MAVKGSERMGNDGGRGVRLRVIMMIKDVLLGAGVGEMLIFVDGEKKKLAISADG